ncbi:MAG: hypothetical protein IPJ32_02000 [Sphingobacteriaceae bacterium]|nr:hypothetical protein [Sphingobacteriaceae bacterium]
MIYVLSKAEICRKLPANAEVKYLEVIPGRKVRNVVSSYFSTIIKIILSDLKDSATRKTISKNFKFYFNVLIGNILLKESFEKEMANSNLKEMKLYSYWCGPWFDVLMLLDKGITDKITFRAHGYDFDVNQRASRCIPYRNYIMKKKPFISFNSQFGYNTYSSKYPSYANKMMYHLGVVEQRKS